MIKITPNEKYNLDLKQEGFQYDAAQENAVQCLQRLFDDLSNKPVPVSGFKKVLNRWKKTYSKQEPSNIKGLYFWGGVGRGKTYLVIPFLIAYLLKTKRLCIFIALCIVYMKS